MSVGVDQDSGFVRSVEVMPANQHDQRCAEELVCGDEEAVYADKGYDSNELRSSLRNRSIKPRIMHRIYPKDHSPRKQALLKKINHSYRKTRSAVERVFGTLKRCYYYRRVRYKGLAKNYLEAVFKIIAYNLRKWALRQAAA